MSVPALFFGGDRLGAPLEVAQGKRRQARMGVAVMDIGSNSVRLLLWREDGREQLLETTRLGEGAAHGRLTEGAMERTAQAIAGFANRAREAGLPLYAFATSAVRDAENAGALLERVKAGCGVKIDVLSGKEEALAAYLGAVRGGSGAVIDIGGNSTELAAGSGGRLERSESLQLGAVRLQALYGDNRDGALAHARACLEADGLRGWREGEMAGVGGTITSLAAYDLGLWRYEAAKVDGHPLTLKAVRQSVETLWSLTAEQRARLPGISQSRAQIIHQGALVLLAAMEALGTGRVLASPHDNLEGYARLRGLEIPAS